MTLYNVSFNDVFISSNSASLFIRRLRRPAFSVSEQRVRKDCEITRSKHTLACCFIFESLRFFRYIVLSNILEGHDCCGRTLRKFSSGRTTERMPAQKPNTVQQIDASCHMIVFLSSSTINIQCWPGTDVHCSGSNPFEYRKGVTKAWNAFLDDGYEP
jgi:hypothetical protein